MMAFEPHHTNCASNPERLGTQPAPPSPAGDMKVQKNKRPLVRALTSASAGEATVIMTCPCAMPSQEAAFLVTEMEMAR